MSLLQHTWLKDRVSYFDHMLHDVCVSLCLKFLCTFLSVLTLFSSITRVILNNVDTKLYLKMLMSLEENIFFLPKGKLKANKIMIFLLYLFYLKNACSNNKWINRKKKNCAKLYLNHRCHLHKKSFKPGLEVQYINILAVLKISNIKHFKALDLYHYSENIGQKKLTRHLLS